MNDLEMRVKEMLEREVKILHHLLKRGAPDVVLFFALRVTIIVLLGFFLWNTALPLGVSLPTLTFWQFMPVAFVFSIPIVITRWVAGNPLSPAIVEYEKRLKAFLALPVVVTWVMDITGNPDREAIEEAVAKYFRSPQ